jgi:hypothetical protein
MTTSHTPPVVRGHCLCGSVQFEVRGPLRQVVYCHCSMCRRSTSHFMASTECARADLHLQSDSRLRWYQSSPEARRGFCGNCGSQLFWEAADRTAVSIAAGAFDLPTGLRGGDHIYAADKGDYYEICDGLPQMPAGRKAP